MTEPKTETYFRMCRGNCQQYFKTDILDQYYCPQCRPSLQQTPQPEPLQEPIGQPQQEEIMQQETQQPELQTTDNQPQTIKHKKKKKKSKYPLVAFRVDNDLLKLLRSQHNQTQFIKDSIQFYLNNQQGTIQTKPKEERTYTHDKLNPLA